MWNTRPFEQDCILRICQLHAYEDWPRLGRGWVAEAGPRLGKGWLRLGAALTGRLFPTQGGTMLPLG